MMFRRFLWFVLGFLFSPFALASDVVWYVGFGSWLVAYSVDWWRELRDERRSSRTGCDLAGGALVPVPVVGSAGEARGPARGVRRTRFPLTGPGAGPDAEGESS